MSWINRDVSEYQRFRNERSTYAETYFALVVTALLLAVLSCVPAHGQQPPPAPSFAQPQPSSNPLQFNQPVYMVRAWTPVRNVLGMQPLYRPYIQIAPAYNAQVIPVAPLGGGR